MIHAGVAAPRPVEVIEVHRNELGFMEGVELDGWVKDAQRPAGIRNPRIPVNLGAELWRHSLWAGPEVTIELRWSTPCITMLTADGSDAARTKPREPRSSPAESRGQRGHRPSFTATDESTGFEFADGTPAGGWHPGGLNIDPDYLATIRSRYVVPPTGTSFRTGGTW